MEKAGHQTSPFTIERAVTTATAQRRFTLRALALRLAIVILPLAVAAPTSAQQTADGRSVPVAMKLYTLDCGLTEFKDGDVFADTGEYAGKPIALPSPCYLIQHGRDWMLWDTGVGDTLAGKPGEKFGGRFSVRRTLASQIEQLGLKPDDIHYVGLSHLHFDHAGNIGLFPKATFLVPASELAAARAKPTPSGVDPEQIAPLEQANIITAEGDYDVFGDGSVVTLKTPGHTPGHHSLLVKLPKSGPVLISGDLFHTRQNLQKSLVPRVNERTNTLASMDRFDRLAANMKARIVVQHAPEDYAAMPAFPKFLESCGGPMDDQGPLSNANIGNVEVFYLEAGSADAPVILLLHGFPSASHMFRDLIPALADRFRVVAPDLAGFGQTKAPPRGVFDYTFDSLAEVLGGFVEAIGLTRYALYIFDYGAPIGLRLAMKHPERVTAIVSQNGNAYVEGFSDQWGPWEACWREPSQTNREACRPSLSSETIRDWQYGTGADPSLLSPDGYELDIAYMARPGAEEIQLDLILDYRSNVALYPAFHAYFREHRPQLLAVWGRHDPAFVPAGAEAYRQDLPEAEVHLIDASHFALEAHHREIAALMRDFLERRVTAPDMGCHMEGDQQ